MQADTVDQRVQALLDFTEDAPLEAPLNNRQFIMQSQQIDRWDRKLLNNEHFQRLTAEHFRSRHSCIIGSYDDKAAVALIRHSNAQGQIRLPKALPSKQLFVEKTLPRSGYLFPRKTFTPPLNSKQDAQTNMERKPKTMRAGRSKESRHRAQPVESKSQNVLETKVNLPIAPQFPKKPHNNVKISTFSFEQAQPFDPILKVEKSERAMVNSMKYEALRRRLRYPSSLEEHFGEQSPSLRENLDGHVLHNFRTKKLQRNRKQLLQLIL